MPPPTPTKCTCANPPLPSEEATCALNSWCNIRRTLIYINHKATNSNKAGLLASTRLQYQTARDKTGISLKAWAGETKFASWKDDDIALIESKGRKGGDRLVCEDTQKAMVGYMLELRDFEEDWSDEFYMHHPDGIFNAYMPRDLKHGRRGQVEFREPEVEEETLGYLAEVWLKYR